MSIFFDADHIWKFDSPGQTTAPNYITESIGSVVKIGMEMPFPTDVVIDEGEEMTVDIADVDGETSPSVENIEASYDLTKVMFDANCATATAATYTATITATSTDGQVVVGKGLLVLK